MTWKSVPSTSCSYTHNQHTFRKYAALLLTVRSEMPKERSFYVSVCEPLKSRMETINCSTGTVKRTKKATDGLWRCCRSSNGGALPWWIASLQRSHFWKTAIWREQALCQAHACSAGTKAADCILRKIYPGILGYFFCRFRFYDDVLITCLEKNELHSVVNLGAGMVPKAHYVPGIEISLLRSRSPCCD